MLIEREDGLYFLKDEQSAKRIAGPIKVTAHGYSPSGLDRFSIQLEWRSRNGHLHKRMFPNDLFYKNKGDDFIDLIADTGFFITTNSNDKNKIIDHIVR